MMGGTEARSKKRTIFGVSSALLMVALLVLCVVSLTVGCGSSSSPEATVEAFLSALENKDAEALLAVMDPEDITQMATAAGQSPEELLTSQFLTFESIKFEDIKMETTETGEDTATVTIVEGSVTETIDGVETTEDVNASGEPVELPLVLVDGTWYLDIGTMAGL